MTQLLALVLGCAALQQVDLEAGFRAPPASARPHTWWHWMNGNVTKEGITADLEAMKRIGLGGAQNFNVSEGIPAGPVKYMSPEWIELVKHAVKEADRLGLELCLHNCAGWSSSGGPWITPELSMQRVVTSETRVAGPSRYSGILPAPETKLGFYRDLALLAFPTPKDEKARIADLAPKAGFEERYGLLPAPAPVPASADAIVPGASIVDLSDRLQPDGRLEWEVPAGNWTLLRFGHTPTGRTNAPSPDSGRGLECDKLSRAAFDAHWAGMMGPVLRAIGPLAGNTLNNCLIDSYEVGAQNWTPRMREEFSRRRGYDLRRFLPVLAGRVVDDAESSERFLWDFRRTIADLFANEYYGRFAEVCHENGLLASIEPYDGPFDCLLCGRDADIPMGEFWVGGGERSSCKMAASLAHAYGRKYAATESFTAFPDLGRWQNHPSSLKAIGDLLYCGGINRFIVHRYAHQPWPDVRPGMTMGQWGTHFERTTTWWEQGASWVAYLARCQFLLQQGLFAADVCYLAGEAVPNDAPYHPELRSKGFDYDSCGSDVLLRRMAVAPDGSGRIVAPDGMSWRLLVLEGSGSPFMRPAVGERLRELVKAGATLLGARPSRSPSLADRGAGDERVAAIAAELWGDCDGVKVKEHRFGAGRVMAGRTVEEALAAMGVAPDFTATRPKLAWIHRIVGDVDLYFVSNQRPFVQEVDASFRVAGRVPELWRPDAGTIETATAWSETEERTVVPLRLEPSGSLFVLFRRPSGGLAHVTSLRRPDSAASAPAMPKIEIRSARYEAVDGAGGADVTNQVRALVEAGESSIPANNGLFGDPTVNHYKRLRVEFTVGGVERRAEADENGTLELVAVVASSEPESGRLVWTEAGKLELEAFKGGSFEVAGSAGPPRTIVVKELAPPLPIAGPWTLRFPPNLGAPPAVTLERLVSWTDHGDAGVRYFSGSAEYETSFEVAAGRLGSGQRLELDLGDVQNFAEVTLNGSPLGVWWKAPFAADVTSLLRAGRNTLKVRVTNLWVNRLIGDEQEPDDCEWNGVTLKAWPRWLVEGTPRPSSKRIGFTTWHHFRKESPLLPSGLLGPVQLRPSQRVPTD